MINKHVFRKSAACKSNQGFTLIEVMMAMVIFVIGILSVAAMQVNATRGNISANKSTRGFTWCSDRMEFLMTLAYTDPILNATGGFQPVAPETDGIDNDHDGQIDEADEAGNTNVSLTYSVTDNVVEPNTKTIEVRVSWRTPLGVDKDITLRSVRARNATAT